MTAKVIKLNPLAARIDAIFATSKDSEFLPAALEILETPTSPQRIALVWIVCAILAAALIWSCLARIDIFATATGRIQPSGRSKILQPFDTGKVKSILITNGTQVKAGDLLVELDETDALAERDAAAEALQAYEAEIVRHRLAIATVATGEKTIPTLSVPDTVSARIRMREQAVLLADLAQFSATRESLDAQIEEKNATSSRLQTSLAARERLLSTLSDRTKMRSELLEKQAGSKTSLIDAQQQLDQEGVNQAYDRGQLIETSAAKITLERKIGQNTKQFLAEQSQKLADAERERDRRSQDLVKAAYKLRRTRLEAPIDGTVQQMAVTTVGQVVSPGQPLLVVVPSSDGIEVEALVPNKDIGFISVGQEAVVKIDAFPFTLFGTVSGKVLRVSRDAVDARDAAGGDATTLRNQNASTLSATPRTQDLVFPVTVLLDRSDIFAEGKSIPLSPGMTVNVEISTGDRRVISYLLAPLHQTVSEAAHER